MPLLALGLLVVSLRAGALKSVRGYGLRGLVFAGEFFFRPAYDHLLAGKWFWRHPRLWPRWLRLLVLWVAPLAAGGVFLRW